MFYSNNNHILNLKDEEENKQYYYFKVDSISIAIYLFWWKIDQILSTICFNSDMKCPHILSTGVCVKNETILRKKWDNFA